MTDGAFYANQDVTSSKGLGGGDNHNTGKRLHLDASRSSSIYGNSTTVQPKAVKSYWIIKY